ncbi:hypothetical protein L2811_01780 [Lactobacillus gasseri]|nr:hypothetical protein [Lactobacillus gasseri]MCZ3582423.1 hypothetical protein [Lactobacillus gasseri]MCZ3584210.1 hypothetical protein [Lactobacillus gasseri]MCZ3587823.1 hypothetical protein [Lactobacillus gasseri]MCZ3587834.1 hypothetical protein [Lactobacillus gasseri]
MNKILFIKHGKNLDENNGGLYAYCAETNQNSISFPLTVNYQGKQYTYNNQELELVLLISDNGSKSILWQVKNGIEQITVNKSIDLSNFIKSFSFNFNQEEQPEQNKKPLTIAVVKDKQRN